MKSSATFTRDEHVPLLDWFDVHAFRGLRSVRLEEMSRLNLLVGRNNGGKTSILEALAIFLRPFDMAEWASVGRLREGRSAGPGFDYMSGIDAIRWMFPHNAMRGEENEEHSPIQISASGRTPIYSLWASCTPIRGIPPAQPRSGFLAARPRSLEGLEEDEGWLVRVEPKERDTLDIDLSGPLEFPLWASLGLRYVTRPRGPRVNMEFLAPYGHRNQQQNLRRLTQSSMDNTRSDIDALLNDLDSDVEGIEIITTPDGRRPSLAVRHRFSGLLPVSVLGDGLRRVLSIALGVQRARNGVLLLDEIEAALHVSALDRVYPWLAHACRALNVQVIATTHSLEAIDAITKVHERDQDSALTAFNLNRSGPPKRYTEGMLRRLVHEQGLDVR